MVKRIAMVSLVLLTFMACQKESKLEKEIAKESVSFKVDRFDQEFGEAEPKDLPRLKEEYPQLFPKQFKDSVWVALLTDTIQDEIHREVEKTYPDFKKTEDELTDLFKHLQYYLPDFKVTRVLTVTSDMDYRNAVILADSLVLISLETYLGEDHEFYLGIQKYFRKNFTQSQIVVDVAQEYAERYVPKPTKRALIDHMVYYGKLLYFKEKMLPAASDARVMGYTDDEMKWADENEREIWGYFVERNLLYQTDPDLRRKFFDIGPYTRFGLELDNESPAQLGRYTGWQIVKQYAERHKDLDIMDIIKVDNETLFKDSNYKPKQK